MKDMYGNEYVRPTACSHPTCPPWQCLQQSLPVPEPMLSPAELEQADRESREQYREIADSLRSSVQKAPTVSAREDMEQIVSDLDLMAEGRMTETASWRETQYHNLAIEAWHREVQNTKSERLAIGAIVGIIVGAGSVYYNWSEFSRDLPNAIVFALVLAALCTWSLKSLLNLVLGLPKEPMTDRRGSRRTRHSS